MHSQPHSRKYDWLGIKPMQNTREQYIPLFQVFLITSNIDGFSTEVYPSWIWYHIVHRLRGGYYNMYMFHHSARVILPPMIRGIWTLYGYHTLDLYNHCRVIQI